MEVSDFRGLTTTGVAIAVVASIYSFNRCRFDGADSADKVIGNVFPGGENHASHSGQSERHEPKFVDHLGVSHLNKKPIRAQYIKGPI